MSSVPSKPHDLGAPKVGPWRGRLKRVFGIDIETCHECGGTVKVTPKAFATLAGQALACIEDPEKRTGYRIVVRHCSSVCSAPVKAGCSQRDSRRAAHQQAAGWFAAMGAESMKKTHSPAIRAVDRAIFRS